VVTNTPCYLDANGCTVCPEIPAVPAVPTTVTRRSIVGWNAGANTVKELDGDLQAVIPLPPRMSAVVIGLKHGRRAQTTPDLVEHGFFFQSLNGADRYQVIERGVTRTSSLARAADDVFVIRRVNGQVRYLVNGTEVYHSAVKSSGPVLLNCCLYTSGDQVGGA
jgi:hypothetical protein